MGNDYKDHVLHFGTCSVQYNVKLMILTIVNSHKTIQNMWYKQNE